MKFSIKTVFFFALFFISCSNEPIGLWDDNIRLSVKNAAFSADGDSLTIKTVGSGWWIKDIEMKKQAVWFINPASTDSMHYSINLDSIFVEHSDNTTLVVKADKNKFKAERQIDIILEDGDYFDYVTITQKGH
jgi:hypothetical protein